MSVKGRRKGCFERTSLGRNGCIVSKRLLVFLILNEVPWTLRAFCAKSFHSQPLLDTQAKGFGTLCLSGRLNHSTASKGSLPRSHRSSSNARGLPLLASATSSLENSYYLTRIVFLRALAFVHLVAFLVAFRQNKALIGDEGITPVRKILDAAQERGIQKTQRRLEWRKSTVSEGTMITEGFTVWKSCKRKIGKFVDSHVFLRTTRELLWDRSDSKDRPLTTLLWLCNDRAHLDRWLDGIALMGVLVSSTILCIGGANVPFIFLLWILQRSLVTVGGVWYGYGWEPQLNELAFHSLFLVPMISLDPIASVGVHPAVLFTIKWHLFRIMMGAGLIKLRSGDRKWKDLTAMYYFYETMPVPNPLTKYFHFMPKWWHRGEVLINHFVELMAPILLLIPGLPTQVRRGSGLLQIAFQLTLISSGNFSFLNWLTIVPALVLLDDGILSRFFSKDRVATVLSIPQQNLSQGRLLIGWLFFVLVARLSIPVIKNLLSSKQVMNASFDPLRLVNTYGAFGTVGENRDELIISSSYDLSDWREYEFKVKPGDVSRIPRFISPFHCRLDWQMWVASLFRGPEQSPWLYSFLEKLLQQDKMIMRLLDKDPWEGTGITPKYIRVDKYRYTFRRANSDSDTSAYWERHFISRFYPRQGVVSLVDLRAILSE